MEKNHEKALKTSVFMAHNSWPMNCPTHTEDNEISRKLSSECLDAPLGCLPFVKGFQKIWFECK